MRESTLLQIVGSGADRTTARELALKIEEAARRPAVARDLETLLHGHLVACGPDTGLIVILADGRGGERRWRRAAQGMEAAARTRHACRRDTLARADAAIRKDLTGWTKHPSRRNRRCTPRARSSGALCRNA